MQLLISEQVYGITPGGLQLRIRGSYLLIKARTRATKTKTPTTSQIKVGSGEGDDG
jgi:hypothetical protein